MNLHRRPSLLLTLLAVAALAAGLTAGPAVADPPPSPTCSAPGGPLYAHQGRLRLIYALCAPNEYPSSATVDPPAHGTVTLYSNLTYAYTPANGYTGPDSFTVHAADANGGWTPFTIAIDVTTTGDTAPNCGSGNGTADVRAGAARAIKLGPCQDAEGDLMTYAILGAPQHGTTGTITQPTSSGDAATVTYTAASSYVGADSIGYAATDDFGQQSGTASAGLNVLDASVNHGPSCLDWWSFISPTSAVHGSKSVALNCGDADGDALTVTFPVAPAHGNVAMDALGSTMTYTAAAGYDGPDGWSYRVDDGHGGVVTVNVSVHVAGGADPVCHNQTITTVRRDAADAPGITVPLPCTDPDGDPLTGRRLSDPQHGTIGFDAGNLTYTPVVGFSGDDAITIVADDNRYGTSSPTTLHVLVTPPNPRGPGGAPTAVPAKGLTTAAAKPTAAAQAAALLGAKGKPVALGLGDAAQGYVTAAKSVTPGARLVVVVCPKGCSVAVDARLALRGTAAQPRRTLKLAPRVLTVTAARPGVVKLQLTKAQRTRLTRAKRGTLALALTAKAGGKSRRTSRSFAVRP
jgi:CxxC motif-containing protein